jgi:hypothetical protein
MFSPLAPTFSLAGYAALRFLKGSLHEPPWLQRIEVETDKAGAPHLVIYVTSGDPMIRRCLPTSITVHNTLVVVNVMVVGAESTGRSR